MYYLHTICRLFIVFVNYSYIFYYLIITGGLL